MYYLCSMKTEKSSSQMRKGVLEFCILTLISEEDAYASDVIQKLKQAKLIVVEGTLYPLLTRLKNDGLLTYRWEESKSGPPRKYYKISEEGLKYLVELAEIWDELVETVKNIRNIHSKN
jgi:PadR family transcriptional regulator, regulatory protein PadR